MAKIELVYGVDFSGAKEAGKNIWIAKAAPFRAGPKGGCGLRLLELSSLEELCGDADRGPALAHLCDVIRESSGALWAMDFPFGLPIEVFDTATRWTEQLSFLRDWPNDAHAIGLEFVRRARAAGGPMHIRRDTDREARTPFDCYHYRIIYQTFFGMRDVLLPLSRASDTAILPFQYRRLPKAKRVLVEACPSSTLKRSRLPHQNYKQPAGGALTPVRLRTRRVMLDGLARHVELSAAHRRTIMRNGGGDALDAVIAAVGGFESWTTCDHALVARHPRYPREGYLYI